MLPLRCLSLLLLSVVVIHCDETTETLIEMKGDKLDEQETTESERVVEDGDGKEANKSFNELASRKNIFIFPESDENELRILNLDYDRLGKIYVAQYYMLFDDPLKRLSLVSLYHSEDSFLSYEGEKFGGTKAILERFEKLNLGKIKRTINSVDSQPLSDGKIIVNVIGKVQENNEPSRFYAQTFIFKPQKGSFFLQHDFFRTIRTNNARGS